MTGRCATCQWWEPLPDDARIYHPTRYVLWREAGECRLTTTGDNNSVESKAYAMAAYSYEAGLKTDPDFGCVQWDGRAE